MCAFTESKKYQTIPMFGLIKPCPFIHNDRTYHSFFSEVYSNCSDELGVKFSICVLVEEACFSHARVTEG